MVTLRSGSPKVVDEASALELARAEIGRAGLERSEPALAIGSAPRLRVEDLLRSGFHRRLHALPTLQRQCWLLRHTGRHDVEAISAILSIPEDAVRSSLAAAASALVEGELAEAEGAE